MAKDDRDKLERVCVALQRFGVRVLNSLGDFWRSNILGKLKDFDLVEWHDIYSGITPLPMVNPHPPM